VRAYPPRVSRLPAGAAADTARRSAWRVVLMFGVVSLAADMVYEGARSVYGPLLAALGASAVVVGLVTGLGEAMALLLRLAFGPLADRTGRYWLLTFLGYGLTVVCVPLLAVTPLLGGAGLAVAVLLIPLERSGKAVRSPSKSALLALAAVQVGRGRGFGVHKAMDQVGAFAGPLLVAAVVATAGGLWSGMLALAVPGAVAMVALVWTRVRAAGLTVEPEVRPAAPPAAEAEVAVTAEPVGHPARVRRWLGAAVGTGLPPEFFRFAAGTALTTAGLVTFGIIGYHLAVDGLVGTATVPVLYAGAMLAQAVAALVVGWGYDRVSGRVLLVLPPLVAVVPPLALSGSLAAVLFGIAVWGLAAGVQDSTIKALVAELVDAPRRATAYGVFAGFQGAAALVGGVLVGWLNGVSLVALCVVVAVAQLAALVMLARTVSGRPASPRPR